MALPKLPSLRLDGKRALVTGAGRGIGASTAQMIAEQGGKVLIADADLEPAEETAAAIRAKGGEALAVACKVMLVGQRLK